jgi:hypothetical protein
MIGRIGVGGGVARIAKLHLKGNVNSGTRAHGGEHQNG